MSIKLVLLIILAAAVALLVLILLFQRKRRRRTHRNSYIEALHALIEGRKDDALQLLTRAVKNGEGDIDAYLQLGNLLREKNQAEKALQIHRGLTVRRNMNYTEEKAIQLAIAEDLATLGKIDRSIQVLESLSQKRKDPDVLLTLHGLYHRNGDYDKAFTMLKDLSRIEREITPGHRAGYLASVAYVMRHDGRKNEAEKLLERARKEDKDSTSALYLSGQLAMEEEDLEMAAEMWERLLRVDIRYFDDILPLLEKVLYESGKFHMLERMLGGLLHTYPREPTLLAALATFYEKKGEQNQAITVLEDERATILHDADTTIKLASLYLRADRIEEARRLLEEVDLHPTSSLPYYCKDCGNRSDAPLSYCNRCSGFYTFTRVHESVTD